MGAALCPAQISWGIRAGVPISDAFTTVQTQIRTPLRNLPHRWMLGPTLEIRLPARLGITFDALYSRISYEGTAKVRGGQWEFPAMLRYRFGSGAARPFLAGGGSFNKITGIRTPRSSVTGVVFGAGIELKVPLLRITPEFRLTRRLEENITLDGLRSNLNQAVFLVGITF